MARNSVCAKLVYVSFLCFLIYRDSNEKELQCYMVSWGHFSPQVAQHAMMLFEGDLELHTDGLLDLGLVKSVSKCGNHGTDMGRHGARDFWGIFSEDIHITPTPFSVPLQTRGRTDLYIILFVIL